MKWARILLSLFVALLISNARNPSFAQNSEIVDSLIFALNKADDPEIKIMTLLALSVETEGSQLDKSRYYAQQALSLSEKADSDIWKIRSKIRIGACYLAANDYITALKFTEEAKESADRLGLTRETAISLGNLSIIYGAVGDYSKSSKYNFQVLKLFEQINDKYYIGVALGNIGTDFAIQGNYEKAIEYLFKSLKIAKDLGDKPGIAYQYNNLAGVYLKGFRDYKEAINSSFKALAVNKELGNKSQEGANLVNIGSAYFNMSQKDSALFYYQNAITILNALNSPLRLAICQILLGEYYSSVNDFDKGLEYTLSALAIGQAYNSIETILSASAVAHSLYLNQKDFENAHKYQTIEYQAKDSLYLQQSKKEIVKLEIQYNQDKLEKVRQIKQQRRNYLIGIIFLGLIAGIVIVVLFNSQQRIKVKNALLEKQTIELEKQAIEKELSFNKKVLSINVLALLKKNQMLADISAKLIHIEKDAIKEETKDAIAKISNELRKSTDDKIWNEFSVRFQEVHAVFYETLLAKFPDLTQNELKLCAYLRLNMSTKDISELTGQSTISIENARYRLRKKFGISNSDVNLFTFISTV
jgi:tetratricopeptide (TPR) repeat protein